MMQYYCLSYMMNDRKEECSWRQPSGQWKVVTNKWIWEMGVHSNWLYIYSQKFSNSVLRLNLVTIVTNKAITFLIVVYNLPEYDRGYRY